MRLLQQYLPFTVLKPLKTCSALKWMYVIPLQQYLPFTVLKRCNERTRLAYMDALQQYLPFTVLKLSLTREWYSFCFLGLQQYLPFTVLKPVEVIAFIERINHVATVLTVYGIETGFFFG